MGTAALLVSWIIFPSPVNLYIHTFHSCLSLWVRTIDLSAYASVITLIQTETL